MHRTMRGAAEGGSSGSSSSSSRGLTWYGACAAAGSAAALGLCWLARERWKQRQSPEWKQLQNSRRLFRDIDLDSDDEVCLDELEDHLQRLGASRHGVEFVERRAIRDGVQRWDVARFVADVAPALDHLYTIKPVAERSDGYKLTFTIPSLVLNWGGSVRAEDSERVGTVHIRVRFGESASAEEAVEWSDWENPLLHRAGSGFSPQLKPGSSAAQSPARKRGATDDEAAATAAAFLPPLFVRGPAWEERHVAVSTEEPSEQSEGEPREFTLLGLIPSCETRVMMQNPLPVRWVQVEVAAAANLAWEDPKVDWCPVRPLPLAGDLSRWAASLSPMDPALVLQGDILPLVHKVCDGSFLEVVAAMMSDEFR